MIRFIHTSDWHLLERIRQLDVDALIVAGDIFDTGTPPSYARKLYFDFLRDVRATGVQVVIVGGNHDSVSTLNESGRLLEMLDIKVVGGITDNPEDEVHVIANGEDPVGIVCAVPFLRDRDVRLAVEGEDADSKSEALRKGIKEHYSEVFRIASEKRGLTGEELPIIATGHLTTTGGEITEGVRDIYIGSLQSYSEEDFPQFDYVALGHLHKKQGFGVNEHIMYCGSPIPLSFMEAQYDKYVLLVEQEAGEKPYVKELTVPRFQELKSIQGTLEEIELQINTLNHTEENPIWVEIVLVGNEVVQGLQKRLQEMTAGLNIEILRIKRNRQKSSVTIKREKEETLETLSVEEVFERRLNLEEELEANLKTKLREAFLTVREEIRQESGK